MSSDRGASATETQGGARIQQAGQLRLARLEGLRAICAFGVVSAHIWGYSHGWALDGVYGSFWRRGMMGLGLVAVPVFFATSAYLLYLPFARRDFGGGDRVDLRIYAWNRARRILPLYWMSLIIVFLVLHSGGTFDQWWRFMIFAENFSWRTEGTVNGALWTVVIDFQYYFLLPFMAVALATLTRRRVGAAALILFVLSCASVVLWTQTTGSHVAHPRWWHHNFPAAFMWLGAGMLLALARVYLDERPQREVRGPLGRADVWILLALPLVLIPVWRLELTPVTALMAPLVLGAFVLPLRDGPIVRLLDWRPLAVAGLATFSIYVWQGPVIDQLTKASWRPDGYAGLLLVTIPVLGAIAAASYMVIERPFLRMRRQWARSSAPMTTEAPPLQVAADAGDLEAPVIVAR